MTHEQFCYWLQGLLENKDGNNLTENEVKSIRKHLDTCFIKITDKANFRQTPPDIYC